ncbi:3-phosphoshikimate 1-carboxyvinyltransferase [Candidatus Poriferisodalis sp.]|uniref:3-phosphoshikimate 1-carboxyvinyltransferase n=1 Tax=Candidatus Poriferisodalis sp. TaxID=3101277 RepID=UPI003B02CA2E
MSASRAGVGRVEAGRATGVVDPFVNGASGTAVLPGSKSITNRAVLCAALACGRSTLDGVLFADDTEAMIQAAAAIGAEVRINRGKRRLVIDGIGAASPAVAGPVVAGPVVPSPVADGLSHASSPAPDPGHERAAAQAPAAASGVHARSSGTTARFVLPVVAALGGRWQLDGDAQLRARPLDDLLAALRSLGITVRELCHQGCLPIEVISDAAGDGADDRVDDGADEPRQRRHVRMRADTSSQFVSGLLLAGPLFGGLSVEIDAAFDTVSRPYIDMTIAVMEAFGAKIDRPSADSFVVARNGYRAVDYAIEPDASAAGYVWAAAALCGGEVRVEGLGANSVQGDVRFADVLGQMGAEVTVGDHAIAVSAPPSGTLRAGSFDLRDCSDAAQTLAVVAAFAEGATTINGIGFIRRKETDRIANTAAELARRGVDAVADPDGITVRPSPFGLRAGLVRCHGDHRMAMAMSLMGLRVAGIQLDDPSCVAKTFPEFFDVVETLRRTPEVTCGAGSAADAPAGPIIAIDGPAASGKSSVARGVAAALGMEYLDTGAMYRAVAWAALRDGIDPHDLDAVAEIARTARIRISSVCGTQQVTVDGQDAAAAIRTPEVDRSVSAVAANPAVRRVLVERQRRWAGELGGGVMEGRDIASVVFPDAALKVFLTATPQARAERRLMQQAAQHVVSGNGADRPACPDRLDQPDRLSPGAEDIAALAHGLGERDRLDASRADSPLRIAPGAVVVDTTELTQDQAVAQVTALFALCGRFVGDSAHAG